MKSTPVIACRDLSKRYGEGALCVNVLHEITLDVERGEQLAIVGASGSGKSTLLHLLGGLDLPDSGEVMVKGENLARMNEKSRGHTRNRSLGFVYQFHHLLPEFTAAENVAMPLLIRRQNTAEALSLASDLLKRVGLGARCHHKPGELSGGERQRAAVARALISQPDCVLADEPTGNLDRMSAASVLDLMLELNREFNTSLIVVTHDQQTAERMHRTVHLEDGKLT
ncbi:MAG: lipoprotein-releasing ABC transporter ATP-binding protein LolD [Arenicellales bacterium]|jgi:lipoprotein-releasing system ATP-binding protein|nr:lipoprotein-releasing system ATP-binding protein LolD [Acidiferrobacteraceae bacterium]MDP6288744.1 lipoprotein-releasing ABC transporter ATP-binding protein LolD [Arenicellales bacterium]MDP7155624.1 lipoprotein-releasing ABC transporter ATP-binding protein LolD [Arenicellales bacterium]MDP7482706.1 lipoprotein-releasing ABC transporter ATP-binding protein LolD [Arenicellales bacterium]MEE1539996.1 lipoprotein-releasing ABC transporter ATP-binding protein LolD [Arenicellales bacterium]|tara:strand:- start:2259 stop:2936 length:678 start_codon:yes stop_codon:yes gene_type:complete